MLAEPFASGTSLLHRLDPRGKLLVAGGGSLVLALSQSFLVVACGAALALILLGLARLPPAEVLRRLRAVNLFNLFFWLFLPLTVQGSGQWQIGPVAVSHEGIRLAALITLKANVILLAFLTLVSTSPLVAAGHALKRLGVPGKFVHLLLFTFRYIHVIELERQRLLSAARVRGFQPRMNWHTYRTYAYLVGMLLVKSLARSQRVYEAMICRGFHGRLYSLHEFHFTREDLWACGGMFLATAGLVGLEWSKILS
jgi:cobalt/nickel transport system permease protein